MKRQSSIEDSGEAEAADDRAEVLDVSLGLVDDRDKSDEDNEADDCRVAQTITPEAHDTGCDEREARRR
jgi:hypothetical protein